MNKPDMSLRCVEYAEVRANSVILNFRTTASDGKRYNTQLYNLDAIISGIPAQDHFSHAGKMVILGSGAERFISDYDFHPSRYACYAEGRYLATNVS